MATNNSSALCLSFLESLVSEKNLDIINEYFINNIIYTTEIGTALGGDEVKVHYQDWHCIFDPLELDIHRVCTNDSLVTCHVREKAKHIGYIQSIAPTQQEVIFNKCIYFKTHEDKIVDYDVLVNSQAILTKLSQISSNDSKNAYDQLVDELYPKFYFQLAAKTLLKNQIKLSPQALIYLCCLFNCESTDEIQVFTGLPSNELSRYAQMINDKFNCQNHNALLDKLNHIKLDGILSKCYGLLVNSRFKIY